MDAVTLAILKGRLEQIADEMDATLFRTAFNPIIAEAHDASHGIYDAKTGETLIQGKSGLPIFVGVMAFAVKAVIDKVSKDGHLQEGDVFIFNDPYDGGTHLSDFRLVKPIFRNGEVFCYLASVGHWHDVGGNVPGNYNPEARESFQEGMLIPPVKLFEAGVMKEDIVDILSANSRLPISLYGDLNGQINALDLGQERLHAILDEYSEDTILDALSALRGRAEQMMREHLRQLGSNKLHVEDYLDNDGVTDTALKLALDMTITDSGGLIMDFSRSSSACDGPVNISRSTTIAATYVALKHIFTDVPANAGVLKPVEFIIPENSFLSVRAPKPVGGYTETILRLIDVVFQCFQHVAPEKVNGCAYGTINALSLAGYRKNGSRWVMFSFFGGGHGGHPEGDGLNHGNAPISTATIPPLEILEAAYPVQFTQWALRPDSGGEGENRGGLGAIYEIELLEEEATGFLFGERGKFAPQGVVGGGKGAQNIFSYDSDEPDAENGKKYPPLISKITGIPLKKGQRVRLETPGGGGYGDVKKRSKARVDYDLKQGYVTQVKQ
ncbi:MAG: hydantoinase B/oxoprolinase family protein [Alphaproteobacteria bacterium]|nr:hydantoinase B/oxoprolinase family protein [Alphaproteobacteria bacterium]MBL6777380.1 hydantoinase B/oxoprolinase family protein [Alphaproteobacteria bacterium]